MQEVFVDGSLGKVQDYSEERLVDLLKNPEVDHVKIFNLDRGNNVGIPKIEEAVIEKIVDKKLEERENKKNLEIELAFLKSQFDKKINKEK